MGEEGEDGKSWLEMLYRNPRLWMLINSLAGRGEGGRGDMKKWEITGGGGGGGEVCDSRDFLLCAPAPLLLS